VLHLGCRCSRRRKLEDTGDTDAPEGYWGVTDEESRDDVSVSFRDMLIETVRLQRYHDLKERYTQDETGCTDFEFSGMEKAEYCSDIRVRVDISGQIDFHVKGKLTHDREGAAVCNKGCMYLIYIDDEDLASFYDRHPGYMRTPEYLEQHPVRPLMHLPDEDWKRMMDLMHDEDDQD